MAEKKVERKKKAPGKEFQGPVKKLEPKIVGRGISTESALLDQSNSMELQKFDLLEKLNILKWSQKNMGRIWELQENQIFKKLHVLNNNIAVVRKSIKKMEVKKMAEDEDKEEDKEESGEESNKDED